MVYFVFCRVITFPEEQLDRVIQKLISQLQSPNGIIRQNAVRILGELGVKRDDVIHTVIPKLIDESVSQTVYFVTVQV